MMVYFLVMNSKRCSESLIKISVVELLYSIFPISMATEVIENNLENSVLLS